MSHFEFDFNEDGSISAIHKDGKPYEGGISLESPNSIARTYFEIAIRELAAMKAENDPDYDGGENRRRGLQAFLMSLVGTEAFLNVYFHVAGLQTGSEKVVDLATNDKTIEHKLAHLPNLLWGAPLNGSKKLCGKVRELYNLRSNLVHPKYAPSSLYMQGMVIAGVFDNQQKLFEDREFCREALRWCLLIVARIGVRGSPTDSRFVEFWTGISDTNDTLSAALGVPPDDL
ncbi:hypothetical protein [Sphingopyxis sp. L1A2A]|uniref:hypothetical protein n=1 Tax=Sphingopyxis sp. L1A2A TaxID=2502247 RepID=UPI0010F865BF|nr:hypothetical protein [Sphingopyxis sp. L1A2A]